MRGFDERNNMRIQWLRPAVLVGLLGGLYAAVLARLSGTDGRERGDVPGWVMVTLMTALLVVALLAIAGPALTKMFNDAISQVGG